MKIDLLWWRHLRAPREHAADPPERYTITDMSQILLDLDPGSSPLLQLMNGKTITLKHPIPVGSYFEFEGKIEKAYAVTADDSDDWFAEPTWRVRISQGVATPVVHWLEDELMPRLMTKSEWNLG